MIKALKKINKKGGKSFQNDTPLLRASKFRSKSN